MYSATRDPIHVALKYLAVGCIDELLVDEAEALVAFLEPLNVTPRGISLVSVWSLCERHQFREALRRCQEQVEKMPEAEEFQSLLGMLLYFNNEPDWRAVCERLTTSDTATEDNKRMATSLLDGSFGKKKANDTAADTKDAAAQSQPAVDYAMFGSFMRA